MFTLARKPELYMAVNIYRFLTVRPLVTLALLSKSGDDDRLYCTAVVTDCIAQLWLQIVLYSCGLQTVLYSCGYRLYCTAVSYRLYCTAVVTDCIAQLW